ncbi:MAG TPA: lactate utilization protein [Bacillota bacterium]|nr:lactate utilization protein [Bacillota bacterium]HPE37951.1 lactate utilization protein [Bacillota bacterium]
MDQFTETMWKIRLDKLTEKLRLNQMDAYIANTRSDLADILDSMIAPGSSVSTGGSMTLKETGVIDYLEEMDIVFFDRQQAKMMGQAALDDIYRHSFSVDYYLASTNALTSEGWLVNVDGVGNRVAAMMYGPKNVVILCGRNKIVNNLDDAFVRISQIAGPANCMRVGKKTTCAISGYCDDCKSTERICNNYSIIKRSNQKGRIKVILMNFEAGY